VKINKKADLNIPLLSIAKWGLIYYSYLKDSQDDLVKMEAEQALIEV
jgi:hypothetical protein